MSRLATYSALERIGPTITTGEASTALGISLSSASRLLSGLVREGQAHRLRRGLWSVGRHAPDPFAVVTDLTRPFPSYVSCLSALDHHGIIDQVPRDIEVASLDRARRIATSGATYSIHHLPPPLFTGWTATIRGPIATPEKAIFDLCYLAAARSGRPRRVPELDLPDDFDWALSEPWLERIPSGRLQTLTSRGLGYARSRAIR